MFVLAASLLIQSAQLPLRHLHADRTFDLAAVEAIQSVSTVFDGLGSVYITDPRAAAIFRFDTLGHHLGQVGRTGSGPGEYRSPAVLGQRGDSLWAWDWMQNRVLLFRRDGTPVRTVVLAAATSGTGVLLRDGSIAVIPRWSTSRAAPDAPPTLPVLRFAADGRLRDTLFALEVDREQMWMDEGGGTFRVASQPLTDSPLLIAMVSGDGFVRVDRSTTGPPIVTIQRFGSDGTLQWTRRLPFTPSPVAPTLVDSIVSQYGRSPAPNVPGVPEPVVRAALIVPPRMVQVLGVATAPDGSVWLRRAVPVGAPVRYTVLSAGGVPRFEVDLPPGGRLVGLGAGVVYVSSLDADDLPRLQRFRLR